MAVHSISAHSPPWISPLAGIRRYAERASDPVPNKWGQRLMFTEPNSPGRAAATAYHPVKKADLFSQVLQLRPCALLTASILLLTSPETLYYLREIHHTLKDKLHVWLSATLILLRNQYFVIAGTTLIQGSENMFTIPALGHLWKVTHYQLPFLQMREA